MMLATFLTAQECIPLGPVDLYMSCFFKYFLASFPTTNPKSPFQQ